MAEVRKRERERERETIFYTNGVQEADSHYGVWHGVKKYK